ncbi:MAG: acetolactate synthase small subunit [Gammaproteobacteria bacterium]|nr:MAG: acetolactate synthase small subunit [Gammaproteobacteria bacterium]
MKRHILAILMENESGALARVASLFAARGYNIESLTVAKTHDNTLSRMTIVTCGSTQIIEQICKQLNKLIDVVHIRNLTDSDHIEREMMLIKVNANAKTRDEIYRLTSIFRADIVDVSATTFVINITGRSSKLDAFIRAVGSDNIKEIVRSGVTGIIRGKNIL